MLYGDPVLTILSMILALQAGLIVAYDASQDADKSSYTPKSKRTPLYLWEMQLQSFAKEWKGRLEEGIMRIGEAIHMRTTRRTSGYPLGYCRPRWQKVLMPAFLTCMAAASLPSNSNTLRFDSDSKELRIDNCLTASITNTMSDFVGKPQVVKVTVKGVGGLVKTTHKGTIKWRIEDDNGVVDTVLLPNSYLVPSMPCCLLSPQHWAQVAKDHQPKPEGTGCITNSKEVQLFWKQRSHTKTIALNPATNVATLSTAPGYKHFSGFSAQIDPLNPEGEQNVTCFQTHVIPAGESDDELDSLSPESSSQQEDDDISFQPADPVE
jgi:hypothetical protein